MNSCGVVAVCGRPPGHRGHHGGYRPVPTDLDPHGLTPAEYAVLSAYARGLSMAQIAYNRDITAQTVKNQISFVYRKLDVNSATEAYVAMGWLTIPTAEESNAKTHLKALHRSIREAAQEIALVCEDVQIAADGLPEVSE